MSLERGSDSMSDSPHYLYLQTTKWDPISIGIRFVTRSNWSHAGLYHDGMFLSAQKDGVKLRPHDKNSKLLFLKVPKAAEVCTWMNTQLGKPYDFTAIFGILIDRNWREDDSWFCSELVAWACEKAGIPLFNVNFLLNRVFPNLVGASCVASNLSQDEFNGLPDNIREWAVIM